jgi:hypothetical protein
MDQVSHTCPWCSASIPAGAATCPACGAAVESETTSDVPGLTVVDPTAKLHDDEGMIPDSMDPMAWLRAGHGRQAVHEDAVEPPSDAVRREMRRMELEAEIENAGLSVMNPTGDETIDAGMPSEEAMEAFEAGLLDDSGPAEEAELDERARGLEIDENS